MDEYTEMLPLGADETPYRCLTTDYVSTVEVDGRTILKVDPAVADDHSHLCAVSNLIGVLCDPQPRAVLPEMLLRAVDMVEDLLPPLRWNASFLPAI